MIKRYKCVVVANGLFPTGQQALELLRQAEFVVACDGAVIGLENGRLPDAVVGDLDSLPEPVRNRYSDRIHRVKDQETNDLTKAVNYVKTLGFREVWISVSGLRYPIEKRRLLYWWEATLNEATGKEFTVILEEDARVLVYRTFSSL